jgi:hypothetical protein
MEEGRKKKGRDKKEGSKREKTGKKGELKHDI